MLDCNFPSWSFQVFSADFIFNFEYSGFFVYLHRNLILCLLICLFYFAYNFMTHFCLSKSDFLTLLFCSRGVFHGTVKSVRFTHPFVDFVVYITICTRMFKSMGLFRLLFVYHYLYVILQLLQLLLFPCFPNLRST